MVFSRYPVPMLSVCVVVLVVVLMIPAAKTSHTIPAAESESVFLQVSDPGTPPSWAQSPSSSQSTRSVPPGEAASGPTLPGPPSMPLSGAALLVLAGGALVWRRFGHSSPPSHQPRGTMSYSRYLLPFLLIGLCMPEKAHAQRMFEFPTLPDTPMGPAIDIAAGSIHSLALQSDGTVIGWGNNDPELDFGQTDIPPGLSDVVQVSAGDLHTLALQSDGTVVAWGDNRQGQINVPDGLTNVVQVSAGTAFSLALRSDGTIIAWGQNNFNQTDVPMGLTDVVQVATGGSHSLALRSNGTVVAWGGTNSSGQLDVPPDLVDAIDISAGATGSSHSLALRSDGTVVAWGSNSSGQTDVPDGLTGVIQISAGQIHSLALRFDGTVVAWGNNSVGQLDVPSGLTDVIQIDSGLGHNLALRSDGTVVAWGWNTRGQADVPDQLPFNNLVQTAGGHWFTLGLLADGTVIGWGDNTDGQLDVPLDATGVVQVSAGFFHSLGLRSDGTVVAWGNNGQGQANVPLGLTDVVQVAGGFMHSLAVRSDGTVVGWGNNGSGQLNVPSVATDVVQVAAGGNHSLALRSNGTVVAWGDNGSGQASVPLDATDVVQVAAGQSHSLALRSNGTVVAWGDNGSGQTSVPSGLTDVVYVAAGAGFSLALLSDGTFEVWGGVPTSPPAGANDDLILASAGFSHITLLKRLPGERSPYLHVHAERRASSFPVGSLAFVDLSFEDGDGLPVTGDTSIRASVYDFDNNLLQVETVPILSGDPWTYVIPEGVPFFRVLLRAQHEDYHYSIHDEVTFIATAATPYALSIGSENEGPGWRMLSSPMVGSPVQRLALANLVQGIPGEYAGAQPNLYVGYDGNNDSGDPNRGFVVPTGLSHHLMPGKGFIWYLWDEDAEPNHNSPGESESYELPVTVSFVGTSPFVETHSVTFRASDRSSVSDDGFYLIGNPYNQPYNVRGIVPSSGAYSFFYYHWDAAEGDYVLFSGFDQDEAPVGAGFFMQFGHYPTLPVTITFGPPLSGPPGGPNPLQDSAEVFMAAFELTGDLLVEYQGSHIPVEIGDRNARVIFSEDATDGFDYLDAGKLTPLSYYWANIAPMAVQGNELVRRSVESRPLPHEPVTIPLALSTYANGLEAGGEFTIILTDNQLTDEWEVILTDLETGETVNLLTDSHSFTVETQPAISADARFEITFTPPTVSGEDSGETYEFGLQAVWPNPTSGTSQVAFTLETPAEITVDVFDVLGRRVAQVANGEYGAGRHVLPLNTQQLASGIYVVRLTSGSQIAVQRVTVAR